MSAIEINGTYYSTFKPETFRKWHDDTPEDFMFSMKASRFTTNRKVLASAGESVQRFIDSGVSELGDKLADRVAVHADQAVRCGRLRGVSGTAAQKEGSRVLRHVMDVRHESFITPAYKALAKKHKVSTVFTDADKFPSFEEPEGDVAYARLMMADAKLKTGYGPKALDTWAERAQGWAAAPKARDVFVYFINGAKKRHRPRPVPCWSAWDGSRRPPEGGPHRLVCRLAYDALAPKPISPDSWPPSSITILP